MGFTKATKKQAKARVALVGPPGSGKTWTSLLLAQSLGEKVALIDTENGSASKYADTFTFDTENLASGDPKKYIDAIHAAEAAGYDVLVIDGLSPAWSGTGGILAIVDNVTARAKSSNTFASWREATPIHNQLVDAMVQCKIHLIVTMRSKVEYVLEENDKGRKVPRKVGMAPIQRDGMEYEFDVVGDMDWENNLVITKSRCPKLSGGVFKKPGKDVGEVLAAWLSDGSPATPPPSKQTPAEPEPQIDPKHTIIDGVVTALKAAYPGNQNAAKQAIKDAFGCTYKELAGLDLDALTKGAQKLDEIINGVPV